MKSTNGYYFYMDGMLLPITPPSLKMTIGSQNKTVTLINDGEINLLKSPTLVDVTFTARFPMIKFPYSRTVQDFQTYYDRIKKLKLDKKPFQFIVIRTKVGGQPSWDTNLTVGLESFTINEDHDYGDDVLIDFVLKQYKSFGVKNVAVKTTSSSSTSGTKVTAQALYTKGDEPSNRPNKQVEQSVVKTTDEDNAYLIAKKTYGNGELWKGVVGANAENLSGKPKPLVPTVPKASIYIKEDTQLVLPAKTKVTPSGTSTYGGIGGGGSPTVVHLKE